MQNYWGTGYYIKEADKSGRITWIFFHPEYSRLGLGKQAVEYCLTQVKPTVKKLVVTTSQLAYQFFEKMRYQLTKAKKDFWGIELEFYEMEMPNDAYASR